jgi:DNA invertase Pin-like site-specific DNA recombinase
MGLTKPKAYSYIRMSTDMQLKGDSRRRQLEASAKYAAKHGLELVENFRLEDIGVSAFKGANITRGALGSFLAAVRAKLIEPGSYLLIESLDRITRQKPRQAHSLFLEIINSGINIATLADDHVYRADNNDVIELLTSIITLARGNEESEIKSFRVAEAWAAKRRYAGSRKLTAKCPAWLRLNKQTQQFEVISKRAAVVQTIFQDCAAGIGNYTIMRRLNERGVQPFGRSNAWQKSYIAKILNNKAAIGQFQPHKKDARGKSVADGPVIDQYFPKIIDEELFYRAQHARSERNVLLNGKGKGRKGKTISNLFSQLAVCAYCDGVMHFENKGDGPKGGKFLVCDGLKRGLGCPSTRWRYDQFEASFLAFVRELDLESLLSGEANATKRAALDQKISSLQGELKTKEIEQEKAYELFQKIGNSDFMATKLRDIETRINEIKSQLRTNIVEQSSAAAEVSQFYEGKDQIRALLDRFARDDEQDDIYKLRSQIASKLRSLVDVIFVASRGSVPIIENQIETLKKRRPLATKKIAELRGALDGKDTKARYFTVRFKDGTIRGVRPHTDDALRYDAQIFGNEKRLQRMDASGSVSKLAQDPKPFSSL